MPTYDPNRVTRTLQRLFLTCPLPASASDPVEALRVYLEICDGFYTEDIEFAVKQFLSGVVAGHNPSFAPTPPLMALELRRIRDLADKYEGLDRAARLQIQERDRAVALETSKTVESRANVKAIIDDAVAHLTSLSSVEHDESAAHRKAMMGRTNETFAPDDHPAATRERLMPAWTAGDHEGRDD